MDASYPVAVGVMAITTQTDRIKIEASTAKILSALGPCVILSACVNVSTLMPCTKIITNLVDHNIVHCNCAQVQD